MARAANGRPIDDDAADAFPGVHQGEALVEYATLEWVDWFNNRRLLEPGRNIPPAEAEDQYDAAANNIDLAA